MSAVTDFNILMQALLNEYITGRDEEEAAQCLRDMNVPSYHHEVVLQALLAACEDENHMKVMLALLGRLATTGEITQVCSCLLLW